MEIRNEDQHVSSLISLKKCYVRFINNTNKTIQVMWISYTGVYVQYRILGGGDFVDVDTYKSHPWIANDLTTKDRLYINGSYIYQPKTTREIIQERYPGRHIPATHEARIRVYITLPLYSLAKACLMTLRNHLLNENDVDQLELPRNLQQILKRMIAVRNNA